MPGAFQGKDARTFLLCLSNAKISGFTTNDLTETKIAIQQEDARLLADHGEAAFGIHPSLCNPIDIFDDANDAVGVVPL